MVGEPEATRVAPSPQSPQPTWLPKTGPCNHCPSVQVPGPPLLPLKHKCGSTARSSLANRPSSREHLGSRGWASELQPPVRQQGLSKTQATADRQWSLALNPESLLHQNPCFLLHTHSLLEQAATIWPKLRLLNWTRFSQLHSFLPSFFFFPLKETVLF